MDVKQLRIANAYSCGATIAKSSIEHASAGRDVFAAMTFTKGDIVGPCY